MHPEWLSNAYLLADEPGGTAVFIDSGAPLGPLHEVVEREGLTVTHLLTTHSHHDHVAGDDELVQRYGLEIVKGSLETGGLRIQALETPGHADDHLAFLVNDTVCFTADILFKDAVGGGPDAAPIRRSVMDVLMTLPPETRVLPGHTEETTIGREWEENPFVTYWRGEARVDRRGRARRRRGGDARRLVARLRRQGQGDGALRRRARGDRRRLPGGTVELDDDHRREGRGVRGAAHDAARSAARGAGRGDVRDDERAADAHRDGRGAVPRAARPRLRREADPRDRHVHAATRRSRWRRRCRTDGHIDTLDIEPKHAEVAQRYFDRSPHGSKITLHLGPATETIEKLEGEFDLVFIDADKEGYDAYYEAVLPRLSARGLIAIDNTLWSGRVLDPQDESTEKIAALNDKIAADDRVVAVQLTVRDGVTLVRRR